MRPSCKTLGVLARSKNRSVVFIFRLRFNVTNFVSCNIVATRGSPYCAFGRISRSSMDSLSRCKRAGSFVDRFCSCSEWTV